MIVEALGWEFEATPWMGRAACAGSDPGLWFPPKGGTTGPARAVCVTCPVRVECLGYALRWGIGFGIWGGLSERERRKLRVARASGVSVRRLPAAHGTTTSYARGCRCGACREEATVSVYRSEDQGDQGGA